MPAANGDRDGLDLRLGTLMAAAQVGDKQAYASLLADCEPIIRRAARRVGATGDLVDDIVQDTLLTLHNARQTYDPSRSFSAWLGVIAKRRAIDALRRTGRQARREVHAPVAYETYADQEADASTGWREAARALDLERAVAALTPSQRQAVDHVALQGQSLSDAALATGKTTGALKVNFHRALATLRGRLERDGDPGVRDG